LFELHRLKACATDAVSCRREYKEERGAAMKAFPVVLVLTFSLAAQAPVAALRGFSAEASRTERDWETKFREMPSPANLRADMERLSARPHHLGSAYDKDNAEWILAKFKEYGLDAKIETYDVLFPSPKERVV